MKHLLTLTACILSVISSIAQATRTYVVPPSKDTVIVTFTSTVKQTIVVKTQNKPVVTTPPVVTPPVAVSYLTLPLSGKKSYSNQSVVVVENLRFENITGDALSFDNCTKVIIRNCFFNKVSGEAISINKGNDFLIEKNLFNSVRTAVYPVQTTGNVRVINNQFVNVKGPMPRGQYVQFNTCTGAGNSVQGNRGECFEGESNPEDLISVFSSQGTPESPITVRDNIFRGGGPSGSGGGIMTGDYAGKYILIEGNKLVNPGQYGIGVAGGSYITVRNNQIFAERKPWNNIAYYAWGQEGAYCSEITFIDNKGTYTNADGNNNVWWDAGNCRPLNAPYPAAITLAEMAVPAHLIDFISAAELLKIRGK